MAIGSAIGISFKNKPSIDWVAYWATLLTNIGFTHAMLPGLTIDKVGGVFTITSQDIDDFRTTYASPVVKYVNWDTGLDTNDGNTPGAAYKTMAKLCSVSFDRAYFAPGNYATLNSTNVFAQSREIFGYGGKANLMRGLTGTQATWTDLGGGMFSCPYTYTAPLWVCDDTLTDAQGDPLPVVSVASSVICAATANTYYFNDAGDLLYIHLTDGRQPDNHFYLNTTYLVVATGKTHYVENLSFMGISITNATATKNVFLAKNCYIKNAGPTHGITVNGNVWSWLEDLLVAKTINDGISYDSSGAYDPAGVELNCVTRNHGITGAANTLNGSTAHTNATLLRMNSSYTYSEGPTVHDIGTAKALCISCQAGFSTTATATHKSAFAVGADGGADATTMWLYDCTNLDAANTFGAENRVPATSFIYARDCNITNVEPGTTLIPY